MKPELAVALDVAALSDLPPVLDAIPADIGVCKIGLELFTAHGTEALELLHRNHRRIFLDLKLHDIPRTVAHAVRAAARLRVAMLTVHASGGRAMLEAAAHAAAEFGTDRPRLLAVTTLTSLSRDDLLELGVQRTLSEQALSLGRLALSAGIDGLVTSVHETATLRRTFGPRPILVTPGIRMPGDATGDQKRVATPAEAVRAGSNLLVVGRSILAAPDPALAARQILEDMQRV